MKRIYNYHRYSDLIATSGLPKAEEFAKIKEAGFEIILSLTMPTDSMTLENEEAILTDLGITYMHIPVDYYVPQVRDFEIFRTFLDAYKGEKLWVHCTKNYRVSAFMYLYGLLYTGEENKALLHKFWMPNDVWQEFINEIIYSKKIL